MVPYFASLVIRTVLQTGCWHEDGILEESISTICRFPFICSSSPSLLEVAARLCLPTTTSTISSLVTAGGGGPENTLILHSRCVFVPASVKIRAAFMDPYLILKLYLWAEHPNIKVLFTSFCACFLTQVRKRLFAFF